MIPRLMSLLYRGTSRRCSGVFPTPGSSSPLSPPVTTCPSDSTPVYLILPTHPLYSPHSTYHHRPPTPSSLTLVSKYLAWHLRRQLAFDITPLCLAIFAICIFERGKIMDPEKSDWFTIFKIIFECTSAYSTIGLSLGTPNNNYSFCGEFGSASKLVVSLSSQPPFSVLRLYLGPVILWPGADDQMIGVMLRGRHRGLPVAIDRYVALDRERVS